MTDLDRLHQVVEGKLRGRGAGRTFAACHNLAGILETCDENISIAWIIPRMSWVFHIRPMLERVLEEHGLLCDCKWVAQNRLLYGTKRVWFIARGSLRRQFGIRYDCFVDDLGELEDYEMFEQVQEQPKQLFSLSSYLH